MRVKTLILSLMIPLLINANDPTPSQAIHHDQIKELNLKLAKMWTRIDELEIRLQKQEEYIKILEKGLTLGIIPNELRRTDQTYKITDSKGHESHIKMPQPEVKKTKKSRIEYSKIVRKAQNSFSKQEYGKAIDLYQIIDRDFSEFNSEGQSYYWIGLSWYYLKEYKNASDQFEKIEIMYPHSAWLSRSKLYLAKIAMLQKHRKQAVELYRELINSYPNSDIESMAKHDLSTLGEDL